MRRGRTSGCSTWAERAGIRREHIKGAWDFAGGYTGEVPVPWIDGPYFVGKKGR